MPYQVTPDWSHAGTAKEIEVYLGSGFKFNGPGLYLTGDHEHGDTLLVVPDVEFPKDPEIHFSPWRQWWPEETRFRIYMYSVPFEFTIIAARLPIPTRQERPN